MVEPPTDARRLPEWMRPMTPAADRPVLVPHAELLQADREVMALHDELDYAHECLDATRCDLHDALEDAAGAHDENVALREQLYAANSTLAAIRTQLARAIVTWPERFDGARDD